MKEKINLFYLNNITPITSKLSKIETYISNNFTDKTLEKLSRNDMAIYKKEVHNINEYLKKNIGFYNIDVEEIPWFRNLDISRNLNQFVGDKVTTTSEYSKTFNGEKRTGTIVSISPENLVADLGNKEYMNIGWLKRA